MRDRRHVEHRVIFNRGVKTSVIAEGTLWTHLARLDVSFKNKVNIRRHLEIDCLTSNEFD